MKQTANYSRLIGVLFLLPFMAYCIGNELISSSLNLPEHLSAISDNKLPFIWGGILLLINSVTVVGIGVILFPVLEVHNKPVALGYLSARILESLILVIGLISLLSILTISDDYVKQGSNVSVYFKTLSVIAVRGNFWAYQTAMFVLGIGSIGFCYLLYQSKLIPSLFAIAGLIGYVLLSIGSVAEFFGYETGVILSIPGGLFEVSFGIYLIVKGLNVSKISIKE